MIKPVFAVCSLHYDPHCVWSLLDLIQSNYFQGHVQINTTLLPNARNLAIRKAIQQNPDFTHLIFIDDDMTDFTAEHAQMLVDSNHDIISALVTMRRPPYTIPITLDDNAQFTPESIIEHIKQESILKARTVGMAFTCLTRKVIDATAENTTDGPVWFTMDREPRPTIAIEANELHDKLKEEFIKGTLSFPQVIQKAVALGMASHLGTSILGEDICFCNRAIRFGFQPYVHCGVIVSHVGSKPITVRDTIRFVLDKEANELYTKDRNIDNDESQETTISSIVPA